MKRLGWFCGALGIMALLSSAASAAPARRVSYHDELAHRAYHRDVEHRDAHRYPMTVRQHDRLHEVLAHEAYHDPHDHHVVNRHYDHFDRPPVYRTEYVPVPAPAPARGLGISTPRFSFWITK